MDKYIAHVWSPQKGNEEHILWGESEEEVVEKLRWEGYRLLNLKKEGKKRKGYQWTYGRIISLCQSISVLLRAGVPLRKATTLLQHREDKHIPYPQIYESIHRGKQLSHTLRELQFPHMACVLLEAGEASGTLSDSLYLIKGYFEKEEKWKKQILSALTYPLFLVVLMVVFIAVAMGYIVPQFKRVFSTMHVELPWMTKALFAASDWFSAYGLYGGLLSMVGIALVVIVLRRDSVKYSIHRWLWRWGGQRDWFVAYDLARLLQVWSIMLRSGVSLMEVLRLTKSLWSNRYAQTQHTFVMDRLQQGEGLRNSLEQSSLGTSFLWDMISIGEESGELAYLLDQCSHQYSQLLEEQIKRLQQLMEPIMLSIMGGMIALLVLSVMMPLFNSINAIEAL